MLNTQYSTLASFSEHRLDSFSLMRRELAAFEEAAARGLAFLSHQVVEPQAAVHSLPVAVTLNLFATALRVFSLFPIHLSFAIQSR
jgi:hypothetical protein